MHTARGVPLTDAIKFRIGIYMYYRNVVVTSICKNSIIGKSQSLKSLNISTHEFARY